MSTREIHKGSALFCSPASSTKTYSTWHMAGLQTLAHAIDSVTIPLPFWVFVIQPPVGANFSCDLASAE